MHLPEEFPTHALCTGLESKHSYRYCSPRGFYPLAGALIPWLAVAAFIACTAGLYLGFFVAPVDASQGEIARIVFIHVTASWASLLIYLAMAGAAGIGLAFNARLASMVAQALAPTGLMFAFLGLWADCLWSKPIWGNWWEWNLRTSAELTLALLYAGFIGLHTFAEDLQRTNKACAALLLAGVLGIAAYVAAVQSWPAQQQDTPLGSMGALDAGELAGLLALSLGLLLYAGAAALLRLRCVILEAERQSDWVARRGGGAL